MSDFPIKHEGCFYNTPADVVAELARLRAENVALKKQILLAQMAIDGEGPRTCYEGSDDEVGVHGCCGEVSYRPHGPGCWWVELQAALAAGEGGNQP